jgi:hypothetical protein
MKFKTLQKIIPTCNVTVTSFLNKLYAALGFILPDPQFGHSVAPFFKNVFLHEVHQNIPLFSAISLRSSGVSENGT